MRKRLFIILSLLITTCGFAMAQALIRGSVVSDSDGSPVIGATIVVDGTSKGTVTNGDGKFSITLPAGKKNVRISYIGFEPQTVAAKDGMKVKLLEAKNELAETIITGYGNFKKASFTGSAQSLKTDAMQDVPVISIADKLSGGVAGVSISQTSGAPGGTKSIRIRGMSSINAGNDPLIVVDGTPVQSGDANPFSGSYNDTGSDLLSTINPNDIESMTVIKDAAAASLYGSRAANGVIVITTKSGKAGKTKLSFRSDWGFSNMAINYRPTLGGDDRRALLSKGLENQAIYDLGMSAADAKAYADSKIDAYASMPKSGWTDWKDLLFRTGSHQNYQMSVTGGNTDTKFYASLAYNKQLGIAYDQGLERITGNANLQHSFGRFDLQVTTQLSRTRQDLANEGTSFTSPIMNYAWVQNPSSTPYNDDGTLNDGCGLFGVNPIFERDHSSDVYTFTKAFSTVKLTYNIWDNLKLSEKIAYDYFDGTEDVLWDKFSNNGGPGGVMQRDKLSYQQLNSQTQLTYEKTFGQHNINALLGFETEDFVNSDNYVNGRNYPGQLYEFGNAAETNASSGYSSYRLTSYLGRIDYNYAGRYYIGASMRTDGTSKLSRDNRWGTFWSVSGAWRFIDEKFMAAVKDVLSDGKLRLSYGVNGTQPSDYYAYMNLYKYSNQNYNGMSGMGIVGIANPDLRWEKNKTWNIGLDLQFIHRISVTLDYYQRKTSDLIYNLPVSMTGGHYRWDSNAGAYVFTQPMNVGEMQNKGFEMTVTSVNFDTKDFNWTTSLNLSHNSNKLTKLDGESQEIISGPMIHRVGEPYYSYYLYEYAGVDAQTGKPLYYINDGTDNARNTTTEIAQANKTIVGKHDPAIEGGLTNTLRYKFIDLSFTLTYSVGGEAFDYATWQHTDGGRYLYGGAVPASYDLSEMWTGPGDTNAKLPKFQYGSASTTASSRWLMPTDYLRLKSLTIGFSAPTSFISKLGLTKARAYFSGSNLLTWKSKDLVVDPEMSPSGIMTFETPAYRTFAFGVELDF